MDDPRTEDPAGMAGGMGSGFGMRGPGGEGSFLLLRRLEGVQLVLGHLARHALGAVISTNASKDAQPSSNQPLFACIS